MDRLEFDKFKNKRGRARLRFARGRGTNRPCSDSHDWGNTSSSSSDSSCFDKKCDHDDLSKLDKLDSGLATQSVFVKSLIDEDEPHLESSDDDKRVTVIPAPKFDIPETPAADTQLNFRPGRGGGRGGSAFLQKNSTPPIPARRAKSRFGVRPTGRRARGGFGNNFDPGELLEIPDFGVQIGEDTPESWRATIEPKIRESLKKVANFGFERESPLSEQAIKSGPYVTLTQTTVYETRMMYGLEPIKGVITATAICSLKHDAKAVDYRFGIVKSFENMKISE